MAASIKATIMAMNVVTAPSFPLHCIPQRCIAELLFRIETHMHSYVARQTPHKQWSGDSGAYIFLEKAREGKVGSELLLCGM